MHTYIYIYSDLPLGGVSSNGFEATIVSPNVLIGGGGARSCGGIPIGGVLFGFALVVGGVSIRFIRHSHENIYNACNLM